MPPTCAESAGAAVDVAAGSAASLATAVASSPEQAASTPANASTTSEEKRRSVYMRISQLKDQKWLRRMPTENVGPYSSYWAL